MGPKPQTPQTAELFSQPLSDQLDPKYELVLLGDAMDWSEIERSFAAHFASKTGRPAMAARLVAGLLCLQHAYDCSDEIAVNIWVANPYSQFFTGEIYLQIESPIDPSSLTRWRKRIGEEGVEAMLMATIKAGRKLGLLKAAGTDRVIVDTTVMPKAVAHPTDSRLLEKSSKHLVKLAEDNGITLRQNFNREAPRIAMQIGRYAHAKQFRRMNKSLRTLKSRVGRVYRDIGRQMDQIAGSRHDAAKELMRRVIRILTQATKDKNKLYALHAPEVECISKGKARNPYEFGVKVSVTTTLKEGFVVGMRSMPSNPYDGHTLEEAIEQVSILAERTPKTVTVDRVYQGAELESIRILRSGQKRGIS
jgi:IS5 family transposase